MKIKKIVEEQKKEKEKLEEQEVKILTRESYLNGLAGDPLFQQNVIAEIKKEIKANDTILGLMELSPENREKEMIKRNAITSTLKRLFGRFLVIYLLYII